MPGVPTQIMQGIEVPASSINPAQFFQLTRRNTIAEKQVAAFAGLGSTDVVPVLQTGIIEGIKVTFTGTLVVTPGTGSCATTGRWPYDLLRAARFTANGQSNLINCHGAALKAREVMSVDGYNDRGVTRGIGGASPGTQVSQGTLSLASESWGVGSNVSAVGAGSYPVELTWYVPVAYDKTTLQGAIFAQTSATDLFLALDWALPAELFTLAGNATAVLSGGFVAEATLYTIPQAPNGDIIIPDLSVFHSLIETRMPAIGLGDNEVRLAGQGVGKQLLRVYGRVFNGPSIAPLPVNSASYGQMLWRFGGNDTPEVHVAGNLMAHATEELYSSDMGTTGGWWVWDYAARNAFRDSVDEATATELRFLVNIANGVVLSNPFGEYVQETVSVGSAA